MSDPNIIHSGLGGDIQIEGQAFTVQIYALENDPNWILEVVDLDGTSTVWEDPFPSDKAAHEALLAVIETEGIGAFTSGDVIPFPQGT